MTDTVRMICYLRAGYKAGRWDELKGRILDQEFHLPVFGFPKESEVIKVDYTHKPLVDLRRAA